ncbi:hypothetical protein J6590_014945 [Homalodisca vitripennis]|nr:hypothetical protein J6590_014945 [Homalodisca vitripennis]
MAGLSPDVQVSRPQQIPVLLSSVSHQEEILSGVQSRLSHTPPSYHLCLEHFLCCTNLGILHSLELTNRVFCIIKFISHVSLSRFNKQCHVIPGVNTYFYVQ